MSKDTAVKWFVKADNDYKTGSDEFATEEPATDTVCFHAQQCIEKYLKGFLAFHNREIEKTHNLSLVLKQCLAIDVRFIQLQDKNIDILTPHATVYRYPDDFYLPGAQEAEKALEMADEVRIFVRRIIDENH
jgi:HEPN domain-containing protein